MSLTVFFRKIVRKNRQEIGGKIMWKC